MCGSCSGNEWDTTRGINSQWAKLSDRLVVAVPALGEELRAAQEPGEEEAVKYKVLRSYPAVHVPVCLGNQEPLGVAALSEDINQHVFFTTWKGNDADSKLTNCCYSLTFVIVRVLVKNIILIS